MEQTENNFKLFMRIQENKHSLDTLRTITKAIERRFGEHAQVKVEHRDSLINIYLKTDRVLY